MPFIYRNLPLRYAGGILHCGPQLRTVLHRLQPAQQLPVLLQLRGDPGKVLIVHGKGDRVDLRIRFITEKIRRLNLAARQQVDNGIRAERDLLGYLLARLFTAEYPCLEFLGLFLYAGFHLQDFKDRFRPGLFAPRKLAALFRQVFAKIPVHLIKIQHLRHTVRRNVKQEMSAIGNQPRTRHIHQPNIVRLAAVHQLQNQVMDRRVFFVVLPIRHPCPIKEPDTVFRVIPIQRTFFAPNKKVRIDFSDLLRKQIIQKADPLLLPIQPSPRSPVCPAFRCRICSFKQGCAPHRFSPKLFQRIVFIGDCISHRIRSDIQPQIITIFSLHVDKPPFYVL